MSEPINQLEAERRSKLKKIRDLGVDPFGGRTEGLQTLADVAALFKPEFAPDQGPTVRVAGRIIFRRDIGKLVFIRLRDETGELQIALDKKRVDDTTWTLVGLLDLGDIVTAAGSLGATKTGEKTVWATELHFAAKSLLPPPEKWEGLTDVEARYRQRYVDLFTNPQVMRTMKLRGRIVEEVRNFFRSRGFEEVETPMLQPIHGGAAARPFITRHNALDMQLYLRIAPELYLKRLLVGGYHKVFEINRNFRNEGISPRHNPEFTMLEAYEAFGSWETMADLVEVMICTVAMNTLETLVIKPERNPTVRDGDSNGKPRTEETRQRSEEAGSKHRIDLGRRPWPRRTMAELVEERTGWKFDRQSLAGDRLQALRDANPGKDLKHHSDPAEQLVELYEKLVEPTLIDPVFVTRVPGVIVPLARRCRDDDYFADVYELVINGQEISPGYTELNDPDVQANHFRHQVGDREEQQQMEEDFLTALRHGMPPAGGMGVGIDRLVMLLTGASSIRDVILFPLMRPQG